MARFSNAEGSHFPILAYEQVSIFDGIDSELRRTVGSTIKWLVFDHASTEKDPIYHVGSDTGGRKWERAIVIPTYGAFVYQGMSPYNQKGFWNVDTLRASFAADKILRYVPDAVTSPDNHLMDRIMYRGKMFTPHALYLRGMLQQSHTIITVEAMEVTAGESVNDHQFTDNQYPYTVVDSSDDEYMSDLTYQTPEQTDSLPL
jgi:hypothetical protein